MAMTFYSTSKVRKTDLSVLLEQSVGMLPPCNVLLTVNKFRMFGMGFFLGHLKIYYCLVLFFYYSDKNIYFDSLIKKQQIFILYIAIKKDKLYILA